MNAFKGSIVALVTPFKNNKIDEKSLIELLEWHLKSGTHAIVISGTTGESPTLSEEEYKKLITISKEVIKNKIPLIVGSATNSTDTTISKSQIAQDLGADGLLISTPYYNRPTQRGLFEHFKEVANNVDLPIILYNVPSRTSCDLINETVIKLSSIKNIVGIKDATGDLSRVTDLRKNCGEDFILLTGDDASCLAFNAQGGDGTISVTANVAPKLSARMQEFCFSNDYKAAYNLFEKLFPLHQMLFCETNPVPTKYMLSLMHKCQEDVRKPLITLTDENKRKLEKLLPLVER